MSIDFLEFLIYGLAVYRFSRLIVRDEVLSAPREWLWSKFPPESTKTGYLLTCMWCVSVWSASLFTISRIIIPEATYIVAFVLSLSAIAGLLSAYEDK